MNPRNIVLVFFAWAISAGCKPSNSLSVSGAGAPLKLIIAQPCDPQSIPPVVDVLKQSLERLAGATNGQIATTLNISILTPNGELQNIQVPHPTGLSAKLFGDKNPLALREQLDARLRLLETALRKGCSGNPVDESVLKGAARNSGKGGSFTVWAANGSANPWAGESGANTPSFVDDAPAFETKVLELGGRGGGTFLMLTDPQGGATVSSVGADHSPSEPANSQTDGVRSRLNIAKSPATHLEASSASKDTSKLENSRFPAVSSVQQSVSVYTGTGKENGELGALLNSEPGAVVRVGAPIYFDYRSAKLESPEISKVKDIALQIKRRATGGALVELLSGADRRGTDAACDRLAQERARAVEALLLNNGVQVGKVLSVGKNLSPNDTPDQKLKEYRTVQVFLVYKANPGAIVGQNVETTAREKIPH